MRLGARESRDVGSRHLVALGLLVRIEDFLVHVHFQEPSCGGCVQTRTVLHGAPITRQLAIHQHVLILRKHSFIAQQE